MNYDLSKAKDTDGGGFSPENSRLISALLSNPKLTPATLAKHLDPFWIASPHLLYSSLRIAAGIRRGNARIIVSFPPRHGKTRLLSIGTSIWVLENFPHYKIALTSYGADLSKEFSVAVRDSIIKNPHKLNVRIREDMNRADSFQTTKGGGLFAAGLGGAIIGKGANVFFIDDFIKEIKEALSPAHREYIWNWFRTTAMTRLEPNGSMVIVATRWQEDDLIGKILKEFPGEWEYIKFPAIAEENDILGRPPGEALFPERFPIEKLLGLKKLLGSIFFNAIYQQNPGSAEEKITNIEWLQFAPALPNAAHLKWCRVWDFAATEGGGDFTTGGLHAWDIRSERIIHVELIRQQLSPMHVERLVKQTAERDGAGVPIIIEQEPGSAGKTLIDSYARTLLKGHTVIPMPTVTAKTVRAQPYLAGAEAGRVILLNLPNNEWNKAFTDEFRAFPGGDNDDQIDNCSIAWNYFVQSTSGGGAVWGRRRLMEESQSQKVLGDQDKDKDKDILDDIIGLTRWDGRALDAIQAQDALEQSSSRPYYAQPKTIAVPSQISPSAGPQHAGGNIQGAVWGRRNKTGPKPPQVSTPGSSNPGQSSSTLFSTRSK